MRLHPVKFGLAGGIVTGVILFLITLLALLTNFGMLWLAQMVDLYPGYDLSFGGAIVGLVYGFVHGFITFFLIAWVYNLLKPTK